MRVHKLKIWPHFLDEIETGRKTFDLRNGTDRVFQTGDQLHLQAFDQTRNEFIPHRPPVTVDVIAIYTHIPGLELGYVALSIRLVGAAPSSIHETTKG
jgi:hypothetical protein